MFSSVDSADTFVQVHGRSTRLIPAFTHGGLNARIGHVEFRLQVAVNAAF
jgi:type I site-specific restriction endonuclease